MNVDKSTYAGVWIFAEQRAGELMSVVAELLGEGRLLADALGEELCAVLLGSDVDPLVQDLFEWGADKVYNANHPLLDSYNSDGYTKVISEMVGEYQPNIILMGATHIGRDLAPRVAARVTTGLTADCTVLAIDEETKNLLQTRPAFGGNLMATIICANHRPQMATVRSGAMSKSERTLGRKGEVVEVSATLAASDIRVEKLGIVKAAKAAVLLTDADIIVSGGRGVDGVEGFDLIRKLAKVMGGEVGASRAAVDEGWISKEHQVGQTGTTVRPRIYVACGVSGAIQHLAGMQESDLIIAVNTDPDAPIFKVADYGIVGNVHQVIPEFIEAYRTATE